MKAVIVGCGRVGSTLARNLADSGWEVVVIELREENLNRLGEEHRIPAGDLDQMQTGARHIGQQRGGARAGRLFEHQVVALQAERIARHVERDVIETTERELGRGIELALGQRRAEFDFVRGEHIGRYGHDNGARAQAPFCGFNLEAAVPCDARDRR